MRKAKTEQATRLHCVYQRTNAIAILASIVLFCSVSLGYTQPATGVSQKAFLAGAVMVAAAQFPDPSVTSTMIGWYSYGAFNRLLIGFEGAGLVGNRNRARGGYGLFTVGYAAWTKKTWQAYPFWGFGGSRFTVDNRSNDVNLAHGIGLGADVITTSSGHGIMVGARLGYLFRFDDNDFNAIYLSLSFGGGRRR